MAKNDITGDEIKSKVNSKDYEDNYDKIFRKDNVGYPPLTPDKPLEPADKDAWDEKRVDIVGSNGNCGLHYNEEFKYNEGN